MAQYQVGKQMIQETVSALFQTGNAFFVVSANDLEPDVAQLLQFSDVVGFVGPKERSSTDSMLFSDSAAAQNTHHLVLQDLTFTQESYSTNPQPFEELVTQNVLFTQLARVSTIEIDEAQTVIFTQTAIKTKVITGGLTGAEEHTVLFADAAVKVFISVDAVACDSEDTLNFTHRAAVPIFRGATNNVVFTQTALKERIKTVEQDLEFTDVVSIAGSVWNRPAESDLLFSQSFVYEHGEPELCQYQPFIGTGTFPAKPTLIRASSVTLFYPPVSPTLTVQIRAPEIGDRDRLQYDQINRETRGGTLKIFSDSDWPRLQILEVQFTGLKESEAQAVLNFFDSTLGLDVGFTDWEGRTWHGVIVSPERELVRSRRNVVDISFEFEGELQ